MKITTIFIAFIFILPLIAEATEQKENNNPVQCPYGHYWRSYKGGWYGAKRVVKSTTEANEIVIQFYVPQKGIRVHRIIESPNFFQAEIINQKGRVVDTVIIDKRTGRIRSIF